MKIKIVVLSIIVGMVPESYAMQGWRASLSSMLPSAQKYSPYGYFAPGVAAAAMGAWFNRDTSAQSLLGSLRWGIVPLLMGYYVKQQQSQQAKQEVRQQEEVVKPARIIDEKVRKFIINNYEDAAHALMDRFSEPAMQVDLREGYTRLEELYDQMIEEYRIRGLIDPRTYVLAATFGRMIMQHKPALVKQYDIESVNDLNPLYQWVQSFVDKKNSKALHVRNEIIKQVGLADKMHIGQGIYAEAYADRSIDDLVKEIALMFSRKTQKSKNGA